MKNIEIGKTEVQELVIGPEESIKIVAKDQCMVMVKVLKGSTLWLYALNDAKVYVTYENGAIVHYSASSEATVKLFRIENQDAK